MKDLTGGVLFLQIYAGGGILGGTEIYLKNLLGIIKERNSNLKIYLAVFNKVNNIFSTVASEVTDSRFTRVLDSWASLRAQYRFRLLGIVSFLWGLAWMYWSARRLILNHKVSGIYANGGHLTSLVAYLLFREFGIKYVVHLHGVFNFEEFLAESNKSLGSLFLGGITRLMLDNAEEVIANSKDVALDMQKVLKPSSHCSIVHCFVDRRIFTPQDKIVARRKLGLPKDELIIFSGNRLDTGKKIPFLCEMVKRSGRNIKCVIVGDGQLRAEIEELAKSDERFIYLPKVENEKLPVYINAADLVWGVCSVYYISLTLIESLACGVPVMASENPSPVDVDWGRKVARETLSKEAGFLVEEDAVKAAKLLMRLVENRGMLTKMSPGCVNFYEQAYGGKNINRVMKILEKLTAG